MTDGDGLVINGEKIRLAGIDALEIEQSCFAPEGQATRPIEWKNIILYGEYNLDPNKVKTP